MARSLLITRIGELVTNATEGSGPGSFAAISDAALVIADDQVAWTGSAAKAPAADDFLDAAGRAVLPEKTSPALLSLRALVGTLKAEQLEAFKFVLTPPQLETLTEIVSSEVAADEQARNAKR